MGKASASASPVETGSTASGSALSLARGSGPSTDAEVPEDKQPGRSREWIRLSAAARFRAARARGGAFTEIKVLSMTETWKEAPIC